MGWAALLKSAGSKAAMQSGKKMAINTAKEVAVNKVKSVVKKKKVSGKDIAKKMLGGGGESSGGGGALAIRPSTSIVSSPAGGLVPFTTGDEGGALVVKSKEADDLGLTPFMESINGVKESVKSIKDSLNDNLEDAKKRLEKQRLLNAKLRKEEREEGLETKKPGLGLGKKLLSPVTKAGKNFLAKLKQFFTSTLLGILLNGLIGGQRDVVVAFLAGYKAYRMAKEAAVKFIAKIARGIKGGLKGAAGKLANSGKTVFKTLVSVGNALIKWAGKVIQVVTKTAGEAAKRTPQIVRTGQEFLKRAKPLQRLRDAGSSLNKLRKTPIKETIKSIQSSGIGQRIGGTINKVRNFKLPKPGNIWKSIQQVGGNIGRSIQQSGAGKFVSGKWAELGEWAAKKQKMILEGADNLVKNGVKTAQGWGRNIKNLYELAKDPKKLFEVVKKSLDSKIKNVVKKNPLIKKVFELKNMKPAQLKQAVGNFIKNLGKNKNFLKVKDGLKGARKLKIAGLDAVLAALLGLFDYTIAGESPINAFLRASGSLIGYTLGAAAGVPIPVPGASFVTGMAGAWAGEKAADGLSKILSETKLGETPDELMNDGRMWVRDPFSDKALADRAAADEVSMANLGETSKEDGSSISSTTSYEDGASEDETVIIEGGGETTSPSSQTGKSKVVPLLSLIFT